ncbi:hypothetical protein sos41_19370 [Alphaproteobacteria bacterium SO-S41]|nr:hypothetical protein sos41_19370 [Alphaproteobacteria bacterium SO-S41]
MSDADFPSLASEILCTVEFYVAGAMIPIGQTPWRNQRAGYIGGGVVKGERLHGEVLPGGGNWGLAGKLANGDAVSTFDARTVWKTHDGALIYVTHGGRMHVPTDAAADFADPEKGIALDKSRYYARIVPLFETSDERYQWLNALVTVACGKRIKGGIRYTVFAIG